MKLEWHIIFFIHDLALKSCSPHFLFHVSATLRRMLTIKDCIKSRRKNIGITLKIWIYCSLGEPRITIILFINLKYVSLYYSKYYAFTFRQKMLNVWVVVVGSPVILWPFSAFIRVQYQVTWSALTWDPCHTVACFNIENLFTFAKSQKGVYINRYMIKTQALFET